MSSARRPAVAVASTTIAAPTSAPHRAGRLRTALLAAALVAGCTPDDNGGGEGGASPTTTSPAAETIECPDGSVLPDAAPAAAPQAIEATSSGPEPRHGGLDIGTLLPLSGDLSFLGPAAVAGVELAVADVDDAGGVLGAPVGLRHGDSADGTSGVAEGEAARLLGAGVDVVVGPLSSGTAARVLPQVAAGDAVLVSPASTSSGLAALDRDGRLFRIAPSEARQGRALADLVLDDGHRTVSVAARSDEHGQTIADALAGQIAEGGGTILSRVDYDPAGSWVGDDVVRRLDTAADAIVLVGLAETALVVDSLVAAGERPLDRAVYGTDGNLGERLGDLVANPGDLACLKGLLPVSTPDDDFAERVRSHDPALADLEDAGLDLAAESYDAVVLSALAAQAAGSDDAGALGLALLSVSRDGTPCTEVAACLRLLSGGEDIAFVGETGPTALDAAGERTEASLTVVGFDADGNLVRSGSHRGRR